MPKILFVDAEKRPVWFGLVDVPVYRYATSAVHAWMVGRYVELWLDYRLKGELTGVDVLHRIVAEGRRPAMVVATCRLAKHARAINRFCKLHGIPFQRKRIGGHVKVFCRKRNPKKGVCENLSEQGHSD